MDQISTMESVKLNGGYFVWAISDKNRAFFFSDTGDEYLVEVNRKNESALFPYVTPLFVKKVVQAHLDKYFAYERIKKQ